MLAAATGARQHGAVPLTSLFLAPVDPTLAPDLTGVRATLRQLAIIAAPLGRETFLAGEGFGREIVFAGCSPHLVMTPPPDGGAAFCHVALHGPYATPQLITGPNTVKPRCPHCRQRVNDWRDRLEDWSSGRLAGCPSCGAMLQPCALDWRDHALCGRVLVELRNVFPGEAMPSDRLLATLATATSIPWRYAWAGHRAVVEQSDQPTTT